MSNLNAAFQSLPEKVKDWLGDEHVAFIIDEINQRLNFSPDSEKWGTIPHLVLRLCAQDLEPRSFISELSHKLNISFDSAKTLTKEIEEKILKPIEAQLKLEVGVDLKLLYFATARHEVAKAPVAQRVINPIITPQYPAQDKPFDAIQGKPFIIHEHEEAGPAATSMPTLPARPTFQYRVPLANQPVTTPEPSRAKVEMQRVVHYSGFFTRLNQPTSGEKSRVRIPTSKWFI